MRFLALIVGPLVLARALMLVLPDMNAPQRIMGRRLMLEAIMALLFFAGVRGARLGLLLSGAVLTLLFFPAVRAMVMLVIGVPFLGLVAARGLTCT